MVLAVKGGHIDLSACFGGYWHEPLGFLCPEAMPGASVPDVGANPATANVAAIEAPVVNTTVVVPPPPPWAPAAVEATTGELPSTDLTVVILPSPLLVLLSLGPTAVVGSSAEVSLLVATAELRELMPPAIAASSSGACCLRFGMARGPSPSSLKVQRGRRWKRTSDTLLRRPSTEPTGV